MKNISLSPFSHKETEAQRGNLLVGSRAGPESDQLTPSQALFQPAPRWAQGSEFQGGPEAVCWIQRGRAGAEASSCCFQFLQPRAVAEPKFWYLFSKAEQRHLLGRVCVIITCKTVCKVSSTVLGAHSGDSSTEQ